MLSPLSLQWAWSAYKLERQAIEKEKNLNMGKFDSTGQMEPMTKNCTPQGQFGIQVCQCFKFYQHDWIEICALLHGWTHALPGSQSKGSDLTGVGGTEVSFRCISTWAKHPWTAVVPGTLHQLCEYNYCCFIYFCLPNPKQISLMIKHPMNERILGNMFAAYERLHGKKLLHCTQYFRYKLWK